MTPKTDRGHLNEYLAREGRIRQLFAKRHDSKDHQEHLAKEAVAVAQIAARTWGADAADVLAASAAYLRQEAEETG